MKQYLKITINTPTTLLEDGYVRVLFETNITNYFGTNVVIKDHPYIATIVKQNLWIGVEKELTLPIKDFARMMWCVGQDFDNNYADNIYTLKEQD